MGGNKRSGKKFLSQQADLGGLPHAFHMAPGGCLVVGRYGSSPQGVDKGSPMSLGLKEARDNKFSVSGIPDTTGHHRRGENKMNRHFRGAGWRDMQVMFE